MPQFAPGISPINIALAKSILASYDYDGPVSLAWDDTAMEPALQAYKDRDDCWWIIGGHSEPISVPSHEALEEVFKNANITPGKLVSIPTSLDSDPWLIHLCCSFEFF